MKSRTEFMEDSNEDREDLDMPTPQGKAHQRWLKENNPMKDLINLEIDHIKLSHMPVFKINQHEKGE